LGGDLKLEASTDTVFSAKIPKENLKEGSGILARFRY
jgi:hypothetical protein